VPPTVKLTTEAFGKENTGVIYGWIGASHQLGASMAAFGAGAIRTELGDYRLAFIIAGLLCLIAGASFIATRSLFGVVKNHTLGMPAT
jgi:sugar phosphate permease